MKKSAPGVLSVLLLAIAAAAPRLVLASETFELSSLPLKMEQDYGDPHVNKSVDGHSLSIGRQKFDHGVGTHANSSLSIALNGQGEQFSAFVGVDDESETRGSVTFKIEGDGQTLWESGIMRGGQAPKYISVDLHGIKTLRITVGDAGDDIDNDHADWAEAKIIMAEGRPETILPVPPAEERIVKTPAEAPTPRINGAKVFGARPRSPFLFSIAATGDRPMTFQAEGLPRGLRLDSRTGRITGELKKPGEYPVRLRAQNALGQSERIFKIICGSQIGLTPAMGWNSWNCFGSAVTAEKVKAAADAMVRSGLINHGWSYINIDDYWEVHRDSKDPTLQGPKRDRKGNITPNPRFPDMKGLVKYVHDRGMRVGLYSSPGPWTCGGCVGSWQHEEQDARQYGKWGFDYLKYDWCTYGKVAGGDSRNLSRETLEKPYQVMHAALEKQPRDILFSLCQYGMGKVWEWGAEVGGNSWRTTGDIVDTWSSLARIGFGQAGHEGFAGPGHFNDPDMLVVGQVGWGPNLHPTRLTPNEQYTHISLWCLLSAPLLIGCDMTQLDEFTLNLLTNDEVLDVDQDPLGLQARRVSQKGMLEVWTKDLEDGSKAVGLFNRGEMESNVSVAWGDLGLKGKQSVRDLWRQTELGSFGEGFESKVPRHGAVLVKVRAGN